MDREHRGGPQLDDSISGRAENSAVHRVASPGSHDNETGGSFLCMANDLFVRFSKPHHCLHVRFLRSVSETSLSSSRVRLAMIASTLARSEALSATCNRVSSAPYSAAIEVAYPPGGFRVMRKIRAVKDSAQTMLSIRANRHRILRGIGHHKHWTRSLTHDPVGSRTEHQTVKSPPAVCSHDDHFHVLVLSKPESAIRCISLTNYELWLNSVTRILTDELLQPHLTALAQHP
jgi:hypothetical protein